MSANTEGGISMKVVKLNVFSFGMGGNSYHISHLVYLQPIIY